MVVNTRAASRLAEPAQDAQRLLAERLLRAEQRDLVVERLAGERDVGRRDRQRDAVRLDLEEDRARSRPTRCSRAPRTSPGCRPTGTTTRPARPGRGCLPENSAIVWPSPVGRQERVVLLGGGAGHRHEPVGVVGGAVRHRPLLHAVGDRVDDRRVERLVALDRPAQLAGRSAWRGTGAARPRGTRTGRRCRRRRARGSPASWRRGEPAMSAMAFVAGGHDVSSCCRWSGAASEGFEVAVELPAR